MIYSANQAIELDAYSEFLIDFSYNGIFCAFIRLDFSTWESPVIHLRVSFSLYEKYLRLFHDRRTATQAGNGVFPHAAISAGNRAPVMKETASDMV